ncbi:MAG: type II toxin-antitoxin system RelE/ParE family toxin [Dongiaceae bacterium]
MKVRFTPFALAALDAIFNHIEERNPTAALRVKQRIVTLAERLGDLPRIGTRTDLENVRVLVVHPFPYLLFYQISDDTDEVWILDVRHGARWRR